MSKKAFQAIAEGLEDAIAFSKGAKTRGRVRKVRASDVDVAATRGKLGLSQEQFAAAFGVSLGTVRNWEQGRRTPDGPALVLLTVIEKSPRAVLRAIWPGSKQRQSRGVGAAQAVADRPTRIQRPRRGMSRAQSPRKHLPPRFTVTGRE
jgi:putative transcriptional regulator